jgi:hypothetical protein
MLSRFRLEATPTPIIALQVYGHVIRSAKVGAARIFA